MGLLPYGPLLALVPGAARRLPPLQPMERVLRPDPGRRDRYDGLLSLYDETYRALKPIYQRMNG